jgi:putative transposase
VLQRLVEPDQFRSRAFVRTLAANGLVGSMRRVGACGDNAAMESFFALLQKNVLDRRYWHTREDLRLAIITWIERTYHRRRRQRALGKLTPIEFELLHHQPATPARCTTPTESTELGAVPVGLFELRDAVKVMHC